jgi:phosphate starvation-inducible PhoH-like protein
MIITGDPTQTDLPPGQVSGLSEAIRLLSGLEGIGHVTFGHGDVVRHDLVKRIVKAYEDAAHGLPESHGRASDRRR